MPFAQWPADECFGLISKQVCLPRGGIQRGRQTFPTEIRLAGDYLRAQPVRRGLSQPAKLAGGSSVQIRLASLARNFGDRMHDPPDSRACCFSSVQSVRTAQSRETLLGAMALLDDSRWQPGSVPWSWCLGRAHSPCSGRIDSIYDSEPDLCKWVLDVAGDYHSRGNDYRNAWCRFLFFRILKNVMTVKVNAV